MSPIGTWPDFEFPNDIIVTGYDVWVADNMPPRIVKLDTNGNRLFTYDIAGDGPGQFSELHQFSVDSEGNLYGADNVKGRTLKFVPKPGASSTQLIAAPNPPLQ